MSIFQPPGILQCVLWLAALPLFLRRRRAGRAERVALAALVLLSAASHAGFGRFHGGGRFLHDHEFFHYYMGSKYFRELGYDGLYCATYRALAEADPPAARRITLIKNLRTYRFEGPEVCLRRSEGVAALFTEARWVAFTRDVAFFHRRLDPVRWQFILVDHGYNPTPFWTFLGGGIASRIPLSDRSLAAMASLDPLLVAAMMALAARTFGLEIAAYFALFFFANSFAPFTITGGAFLRQLWPAGLVAFVCLYHRRRTAAAGVALGIATLDRVFPGLFALAPLVALLRERRVPGPSRAGHARFAAAFGLTLLALGAASSAATGGVRSWTEFTRNIASHEETFFLNAISLRNLFEAEPAAALRREVADWDEASWLRGKERLSARTRPLAAVTSATALGILLLCLARGRNGLRSLALSAFAPFLLLSVSNYYFVFLAVPFLAAGAWPGPAAAMMGLQAFLWAQRSLMPAPAGADLEFHHWLAALGLAGIFAWFAGGELRREAAGSPRLRRAIATGLVAALGAMGAAVAAGRIAEKRLLGSGELDLAPGDIAAVSGGRAHSELMAAWGSAWSRDDHVVVLAEGPGARALVPVNAPREDRYRVEVIYTAAPVFGTVELSVNGAPAAGPVDLRAPRPAPRPLVIRNLPLREGANDFTFTVAGRDPASPAWHFALDRILVAPESSTPSPRRALERALDWMRAHPADAFDGGPGAVREEIAALESVVATPRLASLHEECRALLRDRGGELERMRPAARRERSPTGGSLLEEEFRDRGLASLLLGPVDRGAAPGAAAALLALADDAEEAAAPAGRAFWAALCEGGLRWGTETGDLLMVAAAVRCAAALGVRAEVASFERGIEFLAERQEPAGDFGAVSAERPDPRRQGVTAAMRALAAGS